MRPHTFFEPNNYLSEEANSAHYKPGCARRLVFRTSHSPPKFLIMGELAGILVQPWVLGFTAVFLIFYRWPGRQVSLQPDEISRRAESFVARPHSGCWIPVSLVVVRWCSGVCFQRSWHCPTWCWPGESRPRSTIRHQTEIKSFLAVSALHLQSPKLRPMDRGCDWFQVHRGAPKSPRRCVVVHWSWRRGTALDLPETPDR